MESNGWSELKLAANLGAVMVKNKAEALEFMQRHQRSCQGEGKLTRILAGVGSDGGKAWPKARRPRNRASPCNFNT